MFANLAVEKLLCTNIAIFINYFGANMQRQESFIQAQQVHCYSVALTRESCTRVYSLLFDVDLKIELR